MASENEAATTCVGNHLRDTAAICVNAAARPHLDSQGEPRLHFAIIMPSACQRGCTRRCVDGTSQDAGCALTVAARMPKQRATEHIGEAVKLEMSWNSTRIHGWTMSWRKNQGEFKRGGHEGAEAHGGHGGQIKEAGGEGQTWGLQWDK